MNEDENATETFVEYTRNSFSRLIFNYGTR